MNTAAASVFDWLLGNWTLVREIPQYASILLLDDGAARYEETALVTLVQGGTLNARQCYVFHRLPSPLNGIEVRFCDTDELFERLEFRALADGVLEARARFLCSPDTYESLFTVANDDRLHIEHLVRGPRKHYRITTICSRIETL
jgi:hypothetical protein